MFIQVYFITQYVLHDNHDISYYTWYTHIRKVRKMEGLSFLDVIPTRDCRTRFVNTRVVFGGQEEANGGMSFPVNILIGSVHRGRSDENALLSGFGYARLSPGARSKYYHIIVFSHTIFYVRTTRAYNARIPT